MYDCMKEAEYVFRVLYRSINIALKKRKIKFIICGGKYGIL